MIEPKAKAFYLELADLMDKHGVLEIGSIEGSNQAEVRSVRFSYYEYDVNFTPGEIRAFVEQSEYAS